MGILRFLFFAILGYYLLMLLGRLLAPWLGRYAARKTEAVFRRAYDNAHRAQEEPREVGEVTIDRKPPRKAKGKKPVGEYIEFEEID
ncbi:MAG TPA: DUF4834 family protein [Robiginitalea sp.]|nr:DUF4834 family protein [Robiginitalea sp.]